MISYVQSNEVLKKQKQLMVFLLIWTPISIILFSLFTVRLSIAILIPTIIFLDLIIYVQFRIMLRGQRSSQIEITDTEVIRRTGGTTEKIDLTNINHLTIHKLKTGAIASIVASHTGGKIGFNGYTDMDEILDHILLKNKSIKVDEKIPKFIITNLPLFVSVTAIVSLGIVIFLTKQHGSLYDLVRNILFAGTGILFLFYKPLSVHSSKKNRKFELIIGSILLLDGIVSFFYNWRA